MIQKLCYFSSCTVRFIKGGAVKIEKVGSKNIVNEAIDKLNA